MRNNFSFSAIANAAVARYLLVLALGLTVTSAGAVEPAAAPDRQHLCSQIFVCAGYGVNKRAWGFTVSEQSQDDWFGMFFKLIPPVSPQVKPVPHKHAEQKAGKANQGGGVGSDRISVHLCLMISALCFFFGFSLGLGPSNNHRD